MPAWNAAAFIGSAIESVLVQSFRNFELLVVDDGSTDHTREVVREFNDKRIRLIPCPHAGIASALNTGLKAARSHLIARFDADDLCDPERLEKQFQFLKDHPGYALVGCDAEYISEDGEHLFHYSCAMRTNEEIQAGMLSMCPHIHSGVMFRRDAVLEAGGYNPHAHLFEDHLLWIVLLKKWKAGNLPESLLKVRINKASSTIDERWRGNEWRRIKKNALLTGTINREEGDRLMRILLRQERKAVKHGSYHALCGKKYLADNYQPGKARWHMRRAISANPFRLDNYVLVAASFLPLGMIRWIRKKMPAKL